MVLHFVREVINTLMTRLSGTVIIVIGDGEKFFIGVSSVHRFLDIGLILKTNHT